MHEVGIHVKMENEMMNLGQQFVHILQAEDMMIHGLFEGDWDLNRARLPKHVRDTDELRTSFEEVHERTRKHFLTLDAVRPSCKLDGPVRSKDT